MILGTTHLGRGERREPQVALEGVVDRIVRWRPHAIAIEALPGERLYPFDDHGNWASLADVPEAAFEEFVHTLHAKAAEHQLVAGDDVSRAVQQGDLWPRQRNSPEVVAESDNLEETIQVDEFSPWSGTHTRARSK